MADALSATDNLRQIHSTLQLDHNCCDQNSLCRPALAKATPSRPLGWYRCNCVKDERFELRWSDVGTMEGFPPQWRVLRRSKCRIINHYATSCKWLLSKSRDWPLSMITIVPQILAPCASALCPALSVAIRYRSGEIHAGGAGGLADDNDGIRPFTSWLG
jgi:hypothetical protein